MSLDATHDKPLEEAKEKIELGYSTSELTGVQAFRVPLEDFAALPKHGSVAPLQIRRRFLHDGLPRPTPPSTPAGGAPSARKSQEEGIARRPLATELASRLAAGWGCPSAGWFSLL